MNEEIIIQKVQAYVKNRLQEDSTGHNIDHIERVVQNAGQILQHTTEEVDSLVVLLACYVHDCIDAKVTTNPTEALRELSGLLRDLCISTERIEHILFIIQNMSFSTRSTNGILTLEGKIVQDADRLDATGAIGIARAFQYGGSKGRGLYDQTIPLAAKDRGANSATHSTLHHFYDKLLLLKEEMNTEPGKRIAEQRHVVLEEFLQQFLNEWNGVE